MATGPGRCTVVGSGLAGAAAAASLAKRGWRVTVLDAGATPASGASGLPVGLLAPHFSLDDNLLSRLTRVGVTLTLQHARELLREGVDWQPTGVLERRHGIGLRWRGDDKAMHPWSRVAEGGDALWHERAGWIKPQELVRAWLGQPGIAWRGGCEVDSIVRDGDAWRLIGAVGELVGEADLVVIAAAGASARLLNERITTHPVRGQISWGMTTDPLAPSPMNGNGHFVPSVPIAGGLAWYCGSTFDRGQTSLETRTADHASNLERLRDLAPDAAAVLAPSFDSGAVNAWTGTRCASADRRPLVGEVEPGLWVTTAMGSRGLTFAALCAELLAARVQGETLPLDERLAKSLDLAR